MATPEVTMVLFERVTVEGTDWVVRVMLGGTGFVARAAPLVAAVGEVQVEGLTVIGGGAVGFLSSVPPLGAQLRVGYLDAELTDTGITFGELPNA